jgi:beige protein homolog 1
MAWIRVTQLDSKDSIPIITIDDSDGLQRLCISIGSENSKKITITTCKGTHKFDNHLISEGQWFHLVLVHQKPRMTASTVNLYINGQLVETAKCGYLGHPGSANQVTTYFGARNAANDAVFDLGPLYMFEEHTLDVSVISVIYEIGFEYSGNWQGSWSKYLVGNELLRSKAMQIVDDEARSPIGQLNFVLQQGKSTLPMTLNVPEDKVLFTISASNIMKTTKSSKGTFKIFNGAYQKMGSDESKCSSACCFGSVLRVCPNRLVDSLWSLGGASIVLKLVQDSQVHLINPSQLKIYTAACRFSPTAFLKAGE